MTEPTASKKDHGEGQPRTIPAADKPARAALAKKARRRLPLMATRQDGVVYLVCLFLCSRGNCWTAYEK